MHEEIKVAWLTTNRSCQNRCRWCYARDAEGQDMDYYEAIQVVDMLAESKINRVILIGGEPTMYRPLPKLIKYIVGKGMEVSLTTNGQKLADASYVRELVDAGISGVNISLKGVTEQDYFDVTGNKRGFEKALQGIRCIKEEKMSVTVSYVVADECVEKIDILGNLLQEEQPDYALFQFEKPVVSMNSESTFSLEKMGRMAEYIYKRLEQTEIKYMLEISFPFCLMEQQCLNEIIEKGRVVSGCHVQSGRGIVFSPSMQVLPCNHFVDLPYVDEKVMTSDAVNQLWESEKVKAFQQKAQCYPATKCKNCRWWMQCGGGCFTRWLYLDPEKQIPGL